MWASPRGGSGTVGRGVDGSLDARCVAREANGRDADGEANADAEAEASSSIAVIENLVAATQEELETLYVACKEKYFTGAPAVSDEYFDALEAKLSYAGSGVVKKYPRCSVRGKAVYSDCVVDEAQMRALQTSYLAILALGTLFALVVAARSWRRGSRAAATSTLRATNRTLRHAASPC